MQAPLSNSRRLAPYSTARQYDERHARPVPYGSRTFEFLEEMGESRFAGEMI